MGRMSQKTSHILSPAEIERYKRHLVLKEVGGQGQQKLKAARVLVVGAGGLGSPLIMYLAAAGVGTIGVVDDDRVSLDNLQRQIVHDTAGVGTAKVESARKTAGRLNPHVLIEAHETRLTSANALDLISRYDIVADGSDNTETRYLVADACYFAKRPLVFGAVGPFDGYVATFKPYAARPRGHALSELPLSLPRTSASRHRAQLRRGRRAGCGRRRHRHAASDGSDEGDHRHRRNACGPATDLRRARRTFRDPQRGLGPRKPADRSQPDDQGLVSSLGAGGSGPACAA